MAALALLQQQQFEDAAELHRRVSADFPSHPEVRFLEAELAVAAGDTSRAVAAIDAAAEAAPGSLPLYLRQADILANARQRRRAIEAAERAYALAGGNRQALWAIGRIHSRCGDPLTASTRFREAARSIDDPALLYDLGTSLFFSGNADAAEATFDELLARAPRRGHAAYIRATARRQTPERNHVDALRQALTRNDLSEDNRASYFYALAKELEDLGEHDASFGALTEGARLKRATLSHDPAAERASIAAISETFTADALGAIAPGDEGEGAIFIVGMPRTGTTLLEYLLARHAGVASAGELPDFGQLLGTAAGEVLATAPELTPAQAALRIDYASLGRDYMDTARQAAAGAPRFVDKMPINYMYCGMIAKALPKAKILHLVRDPMDTCYAVYKAMFANAYPFSYDQDELAEYYLVYRSLMQHWHAAMPGTVLDVHYEDLVGDPDRELQRVMDWCDLDRVAAVDESALSRASMTASATQVREPVHTGSVGKWSLHAEGLAPIRRRLEAAGIAIG
ncbi:hypothetical protein GCM10027188_27900 [Lysobacter humi (ex Lee et al. 2017)]